MVDGSRSVVIVKDAVTRADVIIGTRNFAATDTIKSDLPATALDAVWLRERLDQCRARRQVIILDCCHSGAFANTKSGNTLDLPHRLLLHRPVGAQDGHRRVDGRGRVILASSRRGEYSFEGAPIPGAAITGSLFTAALIKGIRTGDADLDSDGYISVDDAFAYAEEQLKDAGAPQTPQRNLDVAEGRIILACNPRVRPVAATIPPARVEGLQRSRRWVLGAAAGAVALGGGATLALAVRGGLHHDPGSGSSARRSPKSPSTIPPSRVLAGHTEPAWGVAFTGNGTLLASCGGDAVVRLWDVSSGQKVGALHGHVGAIWGLAFNRSDTMLASSGADRTIKLWDTTTHQPLVDLKGHSNWVVTLAFNPQRSTLASGSYDGTVRIWNNGTTPHATLTGHESPVHGVAFSPAGNLLASVGDDRTVRVWNTTTYRAVRVISGHEAAVWG
jgi:hypothetical protein